MPAEPQSLPAEFLVEEGVPLPNRFGGRVIANPVRLTCAKLAVGQSFWCSLNKNVAAHARHAAVAAGDGCKFATRAETRDGVAGTRVWRIA